MAVVALVAGGLISGALTWVGTITQNAGVSFATLVEAGVNVVPPSICILGIGALALGVWPRAAGSVVYAVLGWSLLIELVGGFFGSNRWVVDTSLFHQMAAAPAAPPDWTTAGAMVAVGVVSAAVGGVAFTRRDVTGE